MKAQELKEIEEALADCEDTSPSLEKVGKMSGIVRRVPALLAEVYRLRKANQDRLRKERLFGRVQR